MVTTWARSVPAEVTFGRIILLAVGSTVGRRLSRSMNTVGAVSAGRNGVIATRHSRKADGLGQ